MDIEYDLSDFTIQPGKSIGGFYTDIWARNEADKALPWPSSCLTGWLAGWLAGCVSMKGSLDTVVRPRVAGTLLLLHLQTGRP